MTGRSRIPSLISGSGPLLDNRRRNSAKGDIFVDRTKMWSNAVGKSVGLMPGRSAVGPLLLVALSPTFVIVANHILQDLSGSTEMFWSNLCREGPSYIYSIWPSFREARVWKMIAIFMVVQLVMMKLVPGKTYWGPITPSGSIPKYTVNGLQSYVMTIFLFILGTYCKLYTGGVLYDYLGNILSSMNVFGLTFCVLLYFKGRFLPSSPDHSTSENLVFDYYWGTELYPRVLGWDIKQFTNCRCGMTFWGLYLISCLFKQYELYEEITPSLLANVAIQSVYVAKFFWWEAGYLCSMDIMHDRAGFYICWGCLVFLPCIYTSHTTFLVQNPSELGFAVSGGLFLIGVLCVYVNYDCDNQRRKFRESGGKLKIWGKDPVFIEAKYKTETGETKRSLLLASGWWGLSRHFHYLPEIAAAACWTLPVWCEQFLPYFYIPFLTLLLVDRAFRDDARCRSKYQKYWEQYCKHVPCILLPGIF